MLREYSWQNKSKFRYYKLIVQPDMLNEFVVICNWGSVVTRRGNCKKHAFQSQDEVVAFVSNMMKRRTRRGYELIPPAVIIDNTHRPRYIQNPQHRQLHLQFQ